MVTHARAQANGLLIYAQKTLKLELKEDVYEKLNRWQQALEAYQSRLQVS
jgi:FKBP12-rapamycin complex-associated protein